MKDITSRRTMEGQHVNSGRQAEMVQSSNSSVVLPLKEEPPNGGVQAWLQVLAAFFMYFNTWGKSPDPDRYSVRRPIE